MYVHGSSDVNALELTYVFNQQTPINEWNFVDLTKYVHKYIHIFINM